MVYVLYLDQHSVDCCQTEFAQVVMVVKLLMSYTRLMEKWPVSCDGKHGMVNLSQTDAAKPLMLSSMVKVPLTTQKRPVNTYRPLVCYFLSLHRIRLGFAFLLGEQQAEDDSGNAHQGGAHEKPCIGLHDRVRQL